jgi:hypothetical protein
MFRRKRKNVPENVDFTLIEEFEKFLRGGLRALGFNLGKRHFHRRENIFWFWISKKGPFHLPTVMLDINYLTDRVSLGFLEHGLPIERVLTQLLEDYQERSGNYITIEKQVFVF